MIIFDCIGHMVSTKNAEELHEFAARIGLRREWYQTPGYGEAHAHYDLTTGRMRAKAKQFGATEVSPFELFERAWWYEE